MAGRGRRGRRLDGHFAVVGLLDVGVAGVVVDADADAGQAGRQLATARVPLEGVTVQDDVKAGRQFGVDEGGQRRVERPAVTERCRPEEPVVSIINKI